MDQVDIPKTYGALLIGGLFATILSGAVAIQVVVYFKVYPSDASLLKALVLLVWFLDTCHTGFIWAALWHYLIDYFGSADNIDFIPWSIALTIVFTAILTFIVHCFFAHRIFKLSRGNWLLTVPVVFFAILRLVSACATTGQMIRLHSFVAFLQHYHWLFTLGLALSSGVDILITASLFFLLQANRTSSMNLVIDSLIRYAFETGFLTCAGTIIAMICYITMKSNLIFMGLHFGISKLYANSLLVTLNTRQQLRGARSQLSSDRDFPVLHLDTRRRTKPSSVGELNSKGELGGPFDKLEISIERSVEYHDAQSIASMGLRTSKS